jgi:hypothetical protein
MRSQWGRTSFFVACPPPPFRASAFSAALVHQEVHALARLNIWRALLNISAATGNLTPFLSEVSQ